MTRKKTIQKLSDDARSALVESKETLRFASACIDDVLDGRDSQVGAAQRMGMSPRQFQQHMVRHFRQELHAVPFTPGELVRLMKRSETPSQRILRNVFQLSDNECMEFPEYDEDVFWDEYIASLGNEKAIETLKLCHGSREDDTQRTFAEVAQIRGVTRERIRQITAKSYRKLRSKGCLDILFPCHRREMKRLIRDCNQLERENAENLAAIRELRERYGNLATLHDAIERCVSDLRDLYPEFERETRRLVTEDWSHIALKDLPAELALSVRAYNCLTGIGIHTMSDLHERIRCKSQLMAIQHMGVKSANEVVRVMRAYGICIDAD